MSVAQRHPFTLEVSSAAQAAFFEQQRVRSIKFRSFFSGAQDDIRNVNVVDVGADGWEKAVLTDIQIFLCFPSVEVGPKTALGLSLFFFFSLILRDVPSPFFRLCTLHFALFVGRVCLLLTSLEDEQSHPLLLLEHATACCVV